MIKNYLKLSIRNIWKHKVFSIINIVGLSIGISAALVIYLIVHHDFTFDQFHKDGDRIYRVVSNYSFSGDPSYNSGVCGPLPAAVKNEMTGIESAAPFYTLNDFNAIIPNGSKTPTKFKKQQDVVLADASYFKLFEYQWLAGSIKSALNAPYQVVLTSDKAKVYFPLLTFEQIIGKQVVYEDTIKATVSGIVQKPIENTDFQFSDFISYSTANSVKDLKEQISLDEWRSTSSSSQLFVKISAKLSVANIEQQLNALLKKHNPKKADDNSKSSFQLQALSDLHFNEKYGSFDSGTIANKSTLYGLLTVATFILVLGCINFINLTTAQASQRAKEIGVRKTMGSTRMQLISQFLSETFLITSLAVIVAIVVSPFILKLFADFVSKDIKFDLFGQPSLMVFILLLTIIVSFVSGFYPALVLSSFKPISVLKNQITSGSNKTRNAWLRKSLTVTQFVIAQFFIMATLLISKQIYYALHKDLGFKKDGILSITTPFKNNTAGKKQVFLNQLRAIPQIELVSVGGEPPSSSGTHSRSVSYTDGKKEIKTDLELKMGDENYLNIYKIKLLAGRNLNPSDTAMQLIINQNYAKVLGFKTPQDAIGKYINMGKVDKVNSEIIGVAHDFYPKSLRSPIKPLAITYHEKAFNNNTFHIALKPETAGGGEWKAAIASMQSLWKGIYPNDDFEYQFFDERIAKFYEEEQHISKLLTWATGLSILISCLGLLGLAIYTTNLRTKEIGVRKVLGASVSQIVRLLSTELLMLVILALVIVTPIAWYAMNKWMQNFADKTPISWWIFALSGVGMLIAAFVTLSSQTVKAAISNPVKSLRSE